MNRTKIEGDLIKVWADEEGAWLLYPRHIARAVCEAECSSWLVDDCWSEEELDCSVCYCDICWDYPNILPVYEPEEAE